MATAPDHVPPPLQDLPTAKEKKYDRQLRLWGAAGQVALEETHILLINNGPGVTGVETLKNLVLPGVGHFTILDPTLVSEADLGINFFLDDTSLGKFRAEETVRLLIELNPGVEGHAMTEPLETFITKDDIFAPYNIILATAPIDPAVLLLIERHATALQIPTFFVHCVGYFSAFSIHLPPLFPIVDTHPDPSATTDLRLVTPWPALVQFAGEKTAGLEDSKLNAQDKAHIPWVCLLLHYLDQWKQTHNGKPPGSYPEKTEFRKLVRSGDPHEENFDEACAAVLKTLNPPIPTSAVRETLNASEARDITATTPSFWLIANAIQQFYKKHNELPLPGAVPDMKAQSSDYIRLQNIYKTKAREDCAEVLASVRHLEKETGRDSALTVDEKEVENFCKGAAHIHLVRGRALRVGQAGELISFGDRAKALAMELTNPESLIGLHIAFLAWDDFVATHVAPNAAAGEQSLRVPGSGAEDMEADTEKVTGIAHRIVDGLIKEAGTFVEDPEYTEVKEKVGKFCMELVRAGGAELHNIASLTGGLIAQEVIKVITRQYVPVDNTCVFDGVASKSYVLRA